MAQLAVNAFGPAQPLDGQGGAVVVAALGGPAEAEQLLGHAVDVDRQRDPPIHHDGKTDFLGRLEAWRWRHAFISRAVIARGPDLGMISTARAQKRSYTY